MPYPDFPLFGLWYICLAMAGCLGVVRRDGVAPLSYRFFDCCCDFSILPRILIKGMMVACRSVFFTLVPWQASIVTFALCKCRADPDLLSDYVASFRERQILPSGAAIVDHLCVQRGFHDIQSWHSSRKGRLPIHGLSGNGTDHEGNSSRPGKIRWVFGKEYSSFSGLENLRFHLRNCLVSSCMICRVPGTALREFKCRVFQDAFFQEVSEQGGWLMGLLVLLFILFGSLTVMNMWLGLREGKNFSK